MKTAHTLLEDLLGFEDAGDAGQPRHRQIYGRIRSAVLDGRLTADTPLPPSRHLAKQLGVSRNTVITAYEQLQAEGLLVSRQGSGTRIASLPANMVKPLAGSGAGRDQEKQTEPLPRLAQRVRTLPLLQGGIGGATFLPGLPDLNEFPYKVWSRLYNRHNRHIGQAFSDLDLCAGHLPLRLALSQYLKVSRGVSAQPEQIFITAGLAQSLLLASRVLTDPGDTAWVEDPCYDVARTSLAMADLQLQSKPVDDQGILPGCQAQAPPPRLIYVTSSYQYPLGHTLSMARRLELLALAQAHDAWVLEDDYDGEFRYHGSPIPALAGLKGNQRTLYMGTFSKVLLPTLRCSYIVVPEVLIDGFRRVYPMLGNESSVATQAALAEMISRGYFSNHIKRMRHLYGARRQCLEEQLQRIRGARQKLNPGGLHVPVFTCVEDQQLAPALTKAGLGCGYLSHYYRTLPARQGLMMGFTHSNEEQLQLGCQQLERILEDHRTELSF
ncbi:PLP-dependent aminotransferase family protein [Pseudomaricurvus alkylphenolicus]|uniref:MocR-like pyridoxine biosynthesis transcription factor PdxR n=1 Tax=Pseudomaricurvus alkylphenolicus TaxID=1306991 RepID=UPI00141F43CD|nr:PLP-dependent aminotransferase family protein [Pseudomaricurvus alkylphenolicus]NIB41661.1 PLP-dependent aminotransferase family protein [Pseudomaricurvus alkylphenolicus]